MNTMAIRAAAGLASLGLLSSTGSANTPLTDPEKRHVRSMLNLAWDLLWEDCRNETFESFLNPNSQAGPQSTYTPRRLRSGATRPSNLRDGIWEYHRMLRNNRLCKDNSISGGGSTTMAPGVGADRVTISGPQLTSSLTNANPVLRARDKFQIIRTLMNEMAHVYQERETGSDADLKRCDMERDSDCLSLKFYDSLIRRLESAPGTPHTSLAGIRAEGSGGDRIADCLQAAGATSTAQIAGVHRWMVFHRSLLQDRKDGLFNTQIGQSKSWRSLYYGGRYRSPLLLRRNVTNTVTTRQFTLTWVDGSSRTYTIPNDGKRPVRVVVRRNLASCIYVRAITQGSDGAVCFYTWTDTDKDGLPEAGTRADRSYPAPSRTMRDVDFDGVYDMDKIPQGIGFAEGFLVHDQVNGRLVAYETDANQIDLTGNFLELASDPVFADPSLGDPLAGGFSQYIFDTFDVGLGNPVVLFSDDPNVGQFGDSDTLIVPVGPTGGLPPLGPVPLAGALGPNALLGPEQLPANPGGDMVWHGPVFDTIEVRSENQPFNAPPMALISTDQFGTSGPLPPLPMPESDRIGFFSFNSGQGGFMDVPRLGQAGPALEIDPDNDGNPGELILVDDPPALLLRDPVIPLGPDDVPAVAELRLEPVDPSAQEVPFELEELLPGQPIVGFSGGIEVPTQPIPGTNPPLYFQSLHDFDGLGGPNDAMVLVYFNDNPGWQCLVFTQLDQPFVEPFPVFQAQIPFEPGGVFYQDLDGDGDTDVTIEDWAGGPALCLFNSLDGSLIPGPCPQPCPADVNGDGILDNGDIGAFVSAFLASDPIADFNGDGILDNGDIGAFVAAFLQGC